MRGCWGRCGSPLPIFSRAFSAPPSTSRPRPPPPLPTRQRTPGRRSSFFLVDTGLHRAAPRLPQGESARVCGCRRRNSQHRVRGGSPEAPARRAHGGAVGLDLAGSRRPGSRSIWDDEDEVWRWEMAGRRQKWRQGPTDSWPRWPGSTARRSPKWAEQPGAVNTMAAERRPDTGLWFGAVMW